MRLMYAFLETEIGLPSTCTAAIVVVGFVSRFVHRVLASGSRPHCLLLTGREAVVSNWYCCDVSTAALLVQPCKRRAFQPVERV